MVEQNQVKNNFLKPPFEYSNSIRSISSTRTRKNSNLLKISDISINNNDYSENYAQFLTIKKIHNRSKSTIRSKKNSLKEGYSFILPKIHNEEPKSPGNLSDKNQNEQSQKNITLEIPNLPKTRIFIIFSFG